MQDRILGDCNSIAAFITAQFADDLFRELSHVRRPLWIGQLDAIGRHWFTGQTGGLVLSEWQRNWADAVNFEARQWKGHALALGVER
jgi:hypothetical protein